MDVIMMPFHYYASIHPLWNKAAEISTTIDCEQGDKPGYVVCDHLSESCRYRQAQATYLKT